MYNILNSNCVVKKIPDLVIKRKALQDVSICDKVLHINFKTGLLCNTLSRNCHAITNHYKPTYSYHFFRTTVLDDRATCPRDEIFNSIDSSLSQRSRVLQQFHPQWWLVYTTFHPTIQSGRTVVLPRHWLLLCRHTDQHLNQIGNSKSGGHDRGSDWCHASLPMSCRSGSVVSARETPTSETGTFIRVHRRRSKDRGCTMSDHDYKESTGDSTPRRDYRLGLGGIHQKTRIQFQAIDRGDFTQQGHCRLRGADRKGLRNTRVKKKDVNCAANAMQALKLNIVRLSQETSPAALFPQPPVIKFIPEKTECHCGAQQLTVLKTRRKTVLSMNGPFIAHETVRQCHVCSKFFPSEALLRLVQNRCNIGYDVLVFVGRALFQRHRTIQEVRTELVKRNLYLSASEIGFLSRKYIKFLAVGHQQATPRIRHAMKLAGGYIFHFDATHDGDAPVLMTGMDGLSKIVLANVKLPSENSDHIVPFLRKLLIDYGTPRACVHDMGTGICKAVGIVFPGILDFICHFHFLRDIGKDFLEPAYSLLRKRLRHHATHSQLSALVRKTRLSLDEQSYDTTIQVENIKTFAPQFDKEILPLITTYSFALWALRGKHNGDGYGFPFDRPLLGFAERLLELEQYLPQVLSMSTSANQKGNQHLSKLSQEVSKVTKDSEFRQTVEELRWRCQIFDRLRKAMRIAPVGGGNGLNDDGTLKVMYSIRRAVEKFRCALDNNHKFSDDHLIRKMAKQIDKYGEKLFADPIKVKTPNGTITIYPQRTNNILEQFFRMIRRGHRRKTGNNSMSRTLQTMLADTPLVKNLDNPEYMEILLNGKTNLEELFAEIGAMPSIGSDTMRNNPDRILPEFRALINLPNLPEQMIQFLTGFTKEVKSN